MEKDLIRDGSKTPDMRLIGDYVEGEAGKRWAGMVGFIESTFNTKPAIVFSKETPGWNVKYKKSGKALCTLYPARDEFIALVVLNGEDMSRFDAVKPAYTEYVSKLYDGCRLFNGTKWLMIHVTDDGVLNDVKNLMNLKLAGAGKKS